jgi:hypothetical protein
MALSEINRISIFGRLSQSYPVNRIIRFLYLIAGSCNFNYSKPNTALYILVLVMSNTIFSV